MSKEEIKQIRKQLGWSQERLARELGLSFSTISRWERGESKPSPAAERLLNQSVGPVLPKVKPAHWQWLSADRIDISGIVDIFSGPKDLSVHHDHYLAGSKRRP
jgi:transcriptional regulator with XRE-family HTH domain